MEKTIWTDVIGRKYPSLAQDIETDIAVIGSGLAGIMAAEACSRAGFRVAVLEADCIGGGETAKSSAMVSVAHDYIYSRLICKNGKDAAKEYLMLNKYGLDTVRHCVKNYRLDCDWRDCDMYLFATTPDGEKRLKKERKAYAKLGQRTKSTDETELPFPVKLALIVANQGMLNPYKFVTTLAAALAVRGVAIFEGTRVTQAPDGETLAVGDKTVRAKRFIIATHFPYIDVPGWYFMKMYQSRSHNIAFRTDVMLNNIYESIEDEGFEYRSVERGVVMCGGAGMRTGTQKESCYEAVAGEIQNVFGAGQDAIVRKFSAQDCLTSDLMPFVGHYGGTADNIYVVTGFNKWGFTTAAAAAQLLADCFTGNARNNIFEPDRRYMLKSPIKTLRHIGCVIGGYATALFKTDAVRDADIRPGEAVLVKRDGKRLGLYMNHGGEVDVIEAKCPHLGCGLKWNGDEKSWDCPCHGSRFDTKGNIISGPATEKAVTLTKEDEEKENV